MSHTIHILVSTFSFLVATFSDWRLSTATMRSNMTAKMNGHMKHKSIAFSGIRSVCDWIKEFLAKIAPPSAFSTSNHLLCSSAMLVICDGPCIAVGRTTGCGEPIIGLGILSRLPCSAVRRAVLSFACSSTCFTSGFVFMNASLANVASSCARNNKPKTPRPVPPIWYQASPTWWHTSVRNLWMRARSCPLSIPGARLIDWHRRRP
jgi:hypothetical protein